MSTLLYIPVSPRAGKSHSRRAADALLARRPAGMEVIERDLAAAPPPHPDADYVAAMLTPADRRDGAAEAALALSETLIGELEAADAVLIATPMNNFTAPSALKAWIDHVVRARRTFGFSPDGKVGLLADRPVLALIACGGTFGAGPAAQQDFFSPYLRYVLACIGITRVDVVRLEGMSRGGVDNAPAFAAAEAWVDRLRRTLAG